ncbi:DUF4292 domain-containing protein [Saccharicrinis sp. FJH2]|uniref:DUF4292 domain-containing protein n=1 Tax=Saccharicrinis sp. FJH65 TaxID=3344659 RepID=UPI0035F44D1A
MKNRISLHIASGFLIVVLVSCSVTRKSVVTGDIYSGLNEKKFIRLIETTSDHSFKTLEISKFTANYSGSEEKKNFKGFIRLKHDSVLMVSVSPLMGIELFRLRLDRDSAGFIDRYYKTYFLDGLYGLNQKYGLPADFNLVQSFLLGYDPFFDNSEIVPRKFRETNDFYSVEYYIPVEKSNFGIEYFYAKNLKIKRILVTDFAGGSSLDIHYGSYFEKNDVSFIPNELNITFIRGNTIDKLELSFKNAELNKTLNFPFSISDKYTRVNYK